MKKDPDAKRLKQIRGDINQWRAGGWPPGKQLFYAVWGLPTLGGFFLVMNTPARPLVSAFIFVLISAVALFFARVATASVPKTWSETLDKRLSAYQPQNQVAWNYLQKTASKKGMLDVHDLENWYESEAITVCPRVKKPLRFLNNSQGTALTDPVVPDTIIDEAVTAIMATYDEDADECRAQVRRHVAAACQAAMLCKPAHSGEGQSC